MSGPTAALAQTSPATRDDTPQIDAAIANKDWNAALTQLDARIASNPRDVQAKFKRATVLARLNRDDEAIAAFTELTQAYPELPEPYNNLAALYAKKGRYEDARAALETAVKANPGYALAYDNLGDLYLRLASESYKRAQSLGSKSPLTTQRLAAIQNIYAAAEEARGPAQPHGASGAGAAIDAAHDRRRSAPASGPVADHARARRASPFGGPTGPLPTHALHGRSRTRSHKRSFAADTFAFTTRGSILHEIADVGAFGSAALIANAPAFAQPNAQAAHPSVLFKTTQGDIRVELYPEKAPKTVANFLIREVRHTTARSSTA